MCDPIKCSVRPRLTSACSLHLSARDTQQHMQVSTWEQRARRGWPQRLASWCQMLVVPGARAAVESSCNRESRQPQYAKHSPHMMVRRELNVRTRPCGAGRQFGPTPCKRPGGSSLRGGVQVPKAHDTLPPCSLSSKQTRAPLVTAARAAPRGETRGLPRRTQPAAS